MSDTPTPQDAIIERLRRKFPYFNQLYYHGSNIDQNLRLINTVAEIEFFEDQRTLIAEQIRIAGVQEQAALSMKRATWVIAFMSAATFLIALFAYFKPVEAPVIVRQLPQEVRPEPYSTPPRSTIPVQPYSSPSK